MTTIPPPGTTKPGIASNVRASNPDWVDEEYASMLRRLAAGQDDVTSDATSFCDNAQALAERFPKDRAIAATVEFQAHDSVYYVRLRHQR